MLIMCTCVSVCALHTHTQYINTQTNTLTHPITNARTHLHRFSNSVDRSDVTEALRLMLGSKASLTEGGGAKRTPDEDPVSLCYRCVVCACVCACVCVSVCECECV